MLSEIKSFLQLDDHIATAGQPTVAQIAQIAAAGYDVVINLALHDQDYSLADEAGVVREAGMAYMHIPVQWEHPTRADLTRFCDAMDARRRERVFVHCAANMRVSVFMALYRILQLGWDRERAFVDVARIWQPNAVWAAFIEEMLAEQK
jgi:uncharacterized protein (TIGR01244 family)